MHTADIREGRMSAQRSILIVGYTGGVGSVFTKLLGQDERGFSKVVAIARNPDPHKFADVEGMLGVPFVHRSVDAGDLVQLTELLIKEKPNLVANVGLPYWNMNLMKACYMATMKTGRKIHYLDTACYEPPPPNRGPFGHAEQWAMDQAFKEAGIMGLIGCGFDPGITNAWVAYALNHYFQQIDTVDILDCNGGSHGKEFATNFSLAINIPELMAPVKFWRNGQWIPAPALIDPQAVNFPYEFEMVGRAQMYLLYHEELESLARRFPQIKRMRFFMSFGQKYLQYLRMFNELGLTSIKRIKISKRQMSPDVFLRHVVPDLNLIIRYYDQLEAIGFLSREPIDLEGQQEISPLEFLEKVLPAPKDLGSGYTGYTNISAIFTGIGKNGRPLVYRIRNVLSHEGCYQAYKAQGISTTTAIPAFVGAQGILDRVPGWYRPEGGVYNVEDLDPDHLVKTVQDYSLAMQEQFGQEVVSVPLAD